MVIVSYKNLPCDASMHKKQELVTNDWLPGSMPVKILITSGASCPDAIVENVIEKILQYFPGARSVGKLQKMFE